MEKNLYRDILFGVAVGDAIGVPVEFRQRELIALDPVTSMRAYGTHGKPAGTFSDDSSLTFCLAEALTRPFSLENLANNFIAWLDEGFWTADGDVFDVGIATAKAITNLRDGRAPESAGGENMKDNGNGSLMRILPLLILIRNKPVDQRFELTRKVSSVTHGHIRSIMACFYYLEFALYLLQGLDKFKAYQRLQHELKVYWGSEKRINTEEIDEFNRLLDGQIALLDAADIQSSGYVLHTLEASIYCILTTDSYQAATLKAVNLGLDTDTTAAVTGGLAGIIYGYESIPDEWLSGLSRRSDIEDLAERLNLFYLEEKI